MAQMNVSIRGMHCTSCQILIEGELKKIPSVTSARVNYRRGSATINYSEVAPTIEVINNVIQPLGYTVGESEQKKWISNRVEDYRNVGVAALILILLYIVARSTGLLNLSISNSIGAESWVALVVGLVAGVSTCMALVGGLVLGLSTRHAELHPEATTLQKFRPHLYFNLGRIVGFATFGGVIGVLGQAVKPSLTLLGVLSLGIGAIMIALGLKLIEIFPKLHDSVVTLPTGIARMLGLHNSVKEYSHSGAVVLGALTFFLPCGFTQSIQLLAIGSGSFVGGAITMGLFAIGTTPGLLGVGGLTSLFSTQKARLFFVTIGLVLIFLGVNNIQNAVHFFSSPTVISTPNISLDSAQVVRITQDSAGYHPNVVTVENNRPVRWIIDSTNPYSCASFMVMPEYGITQQLARGENIVEFTPHKSGEVVFSCAMGMFRGKFIVQ